MKYISEVPLAIPAWLSLGGANVVVVTFLLPAGVPQQRQDMFAIMKVISQHVIVRKQLIEMFSWYLEHFCQSPQLDTGSVV